MASPDLGDGTRLRAGVNAAGLEGIAAALLARSPCEGRGVRAPTWRWLLPVTLSVSQGLELRRGCSSADDGPPAAARPPAEKINPGAASSVGERDFPAQTIVWIHFAGLGKDLTCRRVIFLTPIS